MKVSDENVLIHLSTWGQIYHINLFKFESAPKLKKLEDGILVLLVNEMLDEVIVVTGNDFLDDFNE